ncbi:MAG: UDP-3-O-(3-hydroxymyristoyl)glucosamine N-acyltransferase [Bacteroidales bacterium]
MNFTAKQIAEYLSGEVEGDSQIEVHTVAKIEEGFSGALSFLANPKYSKYIYTTQSSIVLVSKSAIFEGELTPTLIRVENPYESFAQLLNLVEASKRPQPKVHPQAFIEDSAVVGSDLFVGAFAYIGKNAKIGDNVLVYPQAYIGNNVTIGSNTTINAGVKIYDDCKIGENCILHAGAVIGADGFGFAPQNDGSYTKIPQIGNVIIEDNVEIGANTAVDRATMGSTIIRKGVKLDNLIQVAHNVEIGENTVIAAQTGVAGSTKIGRNCMFGGQVGISGHITIADGVKLSAQTGVPNTLKEPNEIFIGSPAMPSRKFSRSFVVFKQLPEMKRELDSIKKMLDNK